ncbi:MAG: GtrA family protein [Pseudomonadota bacterium]
MASFKLCFSNELFGQMVRYGVSGLLSNALLYLGFLLLTEMGVHYLIAMSSMYMFGVSLSFSLNKKWTFKHTGKVTRTFIYFLLAHLSTYLFALIVLSVSVEVLDMDFRLVQFVLVFVSAIYLFLLQKILIFRRRQD